MIKLNDLHIQSEPKLIFMANDLLNKGRSNKSYTIKLVNDQHNDEALSQIFSSRALRPVKFEATYEVEGIEMKGYLLVRSVYKSHAEGVFVSGNGALWAALENKKLADYDWSAYNHVLSLANVTGSEAYDKPYIYDLCDRGEFIDDAIYTEEQRLKEYDPGKPTSVIKLAYVDITERYPAISIKTIFETVLNQEGFGVTWGENIQDSFDISDYYLLYTQDNRLRNSSQWEKDSVFFAEYINAGTTSGTGTSIDWKHKPVFNTEQFDIGENFYLTTYDVPETGTYRFQCRLFLTFTIISGTLTEEIFTVKIIRDNGTQTVLSTFGFLAADLTGRSIEVNLDTKPTELQKNDEVYIEINWRASQPGGGSYSLRITDYDTSTFYNSVSRYYGAGSTVQLSTLLPDLKAADFFAKVSKLMNFYSFYREELRVLEIQHGRQELAPATTITPREQVEELTDDSNYWLRFTTDKAIPPLDVYVDNDSVNDDSIRFDFSRTLILDCVRVFGSASPQIPVLWKEGDPTTWNSFLELPPWETKANLRIARYNGQQTGNYRLTYGLGVGGTNYTARTAYPQFVEPNIASFYAYELSIMEGTAIELIARVTTGLLYDQTMFRLPVWVEGYGAYWLDEATQLSGDIYKLKLIK